MPIDLAPPPPPSGSGSGIDLPPPPPPAEAAPAAETAKPHDDWDVKKYGPKPGFWDPELQFAGGLAGFGTGVVTKGIPGLASAAWDMVTGLGTVVGHVTSSDAEPDPEYEKLKANWFGTKPLYTGPRAFIQATNQWFSLPLAKRQEILRNQMEEYNVEQGGKGAFERGFDRGSTFGDVATGVFGPGAIHKGIGAARKSMQFGTELENINKRLLTAGTFAMREAQLSQAERYARTKKEAKATRTEAQILKDNMETTAHARVKALHGEEFPPAEHSGTPTNEQLSVKTKDLIVNTAREQDRLREDAGKLIEEWRNALDTKQQMDPQGFWKSPIGRFFSRKEKVRLGLMKAKPPFETPKFMPTPQEKEIVRGSFERIRGGIPAGGRRVVPVSARDIAEEIKRISGEIGKIRENHPGSPEIGYLERYQESLVKAVSDYVGKPYPSEAYAETMKDTRTLYDALGIKEYRVNPREPKKFTTKFNSTNIFKDPEKFKALRLHIGEEAADNLAMQYLSNNLAGKTSEQAMKFLRDQKWFSEASPNAFEMAHSYVDALATEENNYKVLTESAKIKDDEAAAVKAKIAKIGSDRTAALSLLKRHLASKSGPELMSEYGDIRESLLKSGALNQTEIRQLDENIEKISKMEIKAARNKAIANTVARMAGYGAATYEFNRFMNFIGK
jgi:hypothetical protein